MRLFLDQMIDRKVAERLQRAGHDVECTSEKGMAAADDLEILEYCISSDRVLITLDEHFGDWTVIKLMKHPGVVRLKVNPSATRTIEAALVPFLERNPHRSFQNTLAIVKPRGIRWIRTDYD